MRCHMHDVHLLSGVLNKSSVIDIKCDQMTDFSNNLGGAVVKWINHSPCTGVAGTVPSFTSLSDETLSCGAISI